MNIKYMIKLKENGNLHGKEWSKNKPMSIFEVEQLEKKYNHGKKIPKAFREYLLLAGLGSAIGVVDHDFDELHTDCKEDMEYCGYTIERPYFVFDNYSSQYSIFYLDDTREDPKIYILDPFGKIEGEEPLVRENLQGTFTTLINEAIYRIKNDILF